MTASILDRESTHQIGINWKDTACRWIRFYSFFPFTFFFFLSFRSFPFRSLALLFSSRLAEDGSFIFSFHHLLESFMRMPSGFPLCIIRPRGRVRVIFREKGLGMLKEFRVEIRFTGLGHDVF